MGAVMNNDRVYPHFSSAYVHAPQGGFILLIAFVSHGRWRAVVDAGALPPTFKALRSSQDPLPIARKNARMALQFLELIAKEGPAARAALVGGGYVPPLLWLIEHGADTATAREAGLTGDAAGLLANLLSEPEGHHAAVASAGAVRAVASALSALGRPRAAAAPGLNGVGRAAALWGLHAPHVPILAVALACLAGSGGVVTRDASPDVTVVDEILRACPPRALLTLLDLRGTDWNSEWLMLVAMEGVVLSLLNSGANLPAHRAAIREAVPPVRKQLHELLKAGRVPPKYTSDMTSVLDALDAVCEM